MKIAGNDNNFLTIRHRSSTVGWGLSVLIFFSAFLTGNLRAQTSLGDLRSDFSREGNVILFSGEHADLQLQFCTPSIVRVRASWERSFDTAGKEWMLVENRWAAVNMELHETDQELIVDTGELVVRVKKYPLSVEFRKPDGTLLNTETILETPSAGGMKKQGEAVWVQKKLLPEEHFFGFGERMDFVDQRGKKIQLNVGRGTGRPHIVGAYNILEANYAPVPFFMSTRGYGIFFPHALCNRMGYGTHPGKQLLV
ncbi:hypothetical protein [Halalkalibaculum sp. DA384]|uniref:hypothetical protein n=1 Tax=Halalkalibaculum sp. DA384 TaxID=3373606 RepID=UPI0037548719